MLLTDRQTDRAEIGKSEEGREKREEWDSCCE